MKEGKEKNIIIVILLLIIVILTAFIVLMLTNKISIRLGEKSNSSNVTENDSVTNDTVEYTQDTFKKIVDDELYVLFGAKSLNELSNQRKLTLAFNKVEKEYTNCNNDACSTVEYISKNKLEEAFKKTSIAKLGIEHQSYDVYVLNDRQYVKNKNVMSKRNMFRCGNEANRISDFQKKNNKYIISVKYMFADNCEGWEKFYGTYSYNEQSESNFIVKAYTVSYQTHDVEYIDPQKYLDENYDSIKDKLDTYVYTFEVNNDKIELVDFSIN